MRVLILFFFISCHAFSSSTPIGLREVARNPGTGSVLLIPGLNENGETWSSIIPSIRASRVYYLDWKPGHRGEIEKRILHAIESIPGKLDVFAHSASGVYLYSVLAAHPEITKRVSAHIIASPLGGYGFHPAVILTPIAPLFAYFGGRISYPSEAKNTKIYITSLKADPVMRRIAGHDCRFPRIRSGGKIKAVYLPAECSHVGAVAEVFRIVGP